MRHQGNNHLIKMLNNIRIATLDDDDTVTLKSKFVDPSTAFYKVVPFIFLPKMHQQIHII